MKIAFDHSLLGSEFDWLASDAVERCFFLSTAGFGWLPEHIAGPSYPAGVLSLVMALPIRSDASIRGDQGTSTEWYAAARRGFYAFDWDHGRSCYTLVAEPRIPILKVDLPVELMRVVGLATVEMNWASRIIHAQRQA